MTVSTRPDEALTADRRGPSTGRHLQALTGLRLFAALAVYFSHLPAPLGAPRWLLTLQQSGYVGVTFFFVLSGFVLTLNYFDTLRTPQQLWSYAVARIARVYPLYLVVLAWPTIGLWAAGTLPKHDLLLHVLGLQAWNSDLGVAYGFVAPAWSISVELFLYATLPLLVAMVRLVDRRIWTLLGSVALVLAVLAATAYVFQRTGRGDLGWADPASAHRWLYRTPLMRVGDFLLGILAARIYLKLRDRAVGARLGWWLIVPAAGVSVILAAQPALVFTAWSWDAMYAPLAAALILSLALAPTHPVSRLLSQRTIVFLGEASFAFYLIHYTVLHLLGAGAWSSGVTPALVVVEAFNLGLTTALAIGLHVGIEKPARVIVKRLLGRKPAAGDDRIPPRRRHAGGADRPLDRSRPSRHSNRPAQEELLDVPQPVRQRELVDAMSAPVAPAQDGWTPPATRAPADDPIPVSVPATAPPRRTVSPR